MEKPESIAAQLGYLTRAVEGLHEDVKSSRAALEAHRDEAREGKAEDHRRIEQLEKNMATWKGVFIGASLFMSATWAIITFLWK